MFLYIFLATSVVLVIALVVFIKTSKNIVAKTLNKKIFLKKAKKAKLSAIVISGPSGVGKGTIIEKLKTEFPTNFAFSVSHTTRKPRAGEVDGEDYHFVSKAEFEKMIAENKFIEHASVHSNYYGTSQAALEKVSTAGRVAIVEIDVKGAKIFKEKLKATAMSAIFIFMKAPTLAELEKRIRGRGKDAEEKIQERLATAKEELEFVQANESLYDRTIVNKDLLDTYSRVKRFLQLYGGL